MEKNGWKFPDKSNFITDKWEYLGNCWNLASDIKEYYYLIELDYEEIIKLTGLKLMSEWRGVQPRD